MNREVMVSELMIERWASRFMEIQRATGSEDAAKWVKAFLNTADIQRVTAAVREKRYKK